MLQMKPRKKNERSEQIRRRLVTVRTMVTGDNRSAFARKLGLSVNRWNNYEHGYPVSLSVIIEIMNLNIGITAGYLIDGDSGGMEHRLAIKLSELEARLFSPKGKSSS